MYCLSVMVAASPQMRCSTGRTLSAWISWIFRKKSSVSPISIPESIIPTPSAIRVCTQLCKTDASSFRPAPSSTDIITGEPPPPKVAGSVNLYTEEFFSLMKSRLKEGGIATFWLPINQVKVDEAKAILRAFHNAFPNALVWASADQQWIMMGIKGPGRRVNEEELRRLWSEPAAAGPGFAAGRRRSSTTIGRIVFDGRRGDRSHHAGRSALNGQLSQAANGRGVG